MGAGTPVPSACEFCRAARIPDDVGVVRAPDAEFECGTSIIDYHTTRGRVCYEREIANLRSRLQRQALPADWRKAPGYLDWVRARGCIACRTSDRNPHWEPAEPHHLKGDLLASGVGLKAPDVLAMPLCRAHHDLIHNCCPRWLDLQREYLLRTMVEAVMDGAIVSGMEDL